jgi:hypothetical protein
MHFMEDRRPNNEYQPVHVPFYSRMKQWYSHQTQFHEISYTGLLSKFIETSRLWVKSQKETDTLHK